jgi:hypothetical protein
MQKTNINYSGRNVYKQGSIFYYEGSRFSTLANAKNSRGYKDSYYLGKTNAKISKIGRYYVLMFRLNNDRQKEMKERFNK